MSISKTAILAALFAGGFATALLAQDSTATAAVDCEAQFTALDTDANGYLSESEAPREFARSRVDAVTLDANGIGKDTMLAQCANTQWANVQQDDGAPLEGANSFTEAQARDRALSRNVTEVSPLVLDDKGIWRGIGKIDDAEVDVAVDFKGNVTTTQK